MWCYLPDAVLAAAPLTEPPAVGLRGQVAGGGGIAATGVLGSSALEAALSSPGLGTGVSAGCWRGTGAECWRGTGAGCWRGTAC